MTKVPIIHLFSVNLLQMVIMIIQCSCPYNFPRLPQFGFSFSWLEMPNRKTSIRCKKCSSVQWPFGERMHLLFPFDILTNGCKSLQRIPLNGLLYSRKFWMFEISSSCILWFWVTCNLMTETPQVVKCCKQGWELAEEQDFQTSLSCVRSKGGKVGYFNNTLLPPPSPSPSCNPCHHHDEEATWGLQDYVTHFKFFSAAFTAVKQWSTQVILQRSKANWKLSFNSPTITALPSFQLLQFFNILQ